MARNAGRSQQRVAARLRHQSTSKVTKMWQFVKEGPAFAPLAPARGRAVAELVRAAVADAARRAVRFKPCVELLDGRVQELPVEVEALLPRAPRGGLGVKGVEVAVLLAVAAYFVAGLVGFLVA